VSTLTRPNGPLPARVYWTRRLVALTVGLALVFGLGRLLTVGSDGSSQPDRGQQVAAEPSNDASASSAGSRAGTGKDEKSRSARKKKRLAEQPSAGPTTPVLAEPTGPCSDSDILVTPVVTAPVAGSEILISLDVRTLVTEACTWTASPATMTMKITSGRDEIWASRECPTAIPERALVVRQDVGVTIDVLWSGKRSDTTCSAVTEWAMPGWYHVVAAALAGEPTDLQVELVRPARAVVTTTITPTPTPGDGKKRPKSPDSSQPTDEPTSGSPTGAVEPG